MANYVPTFQHGKPLLVSEIFGCENLLRSIQAQIAQHGNIGPVSHENALGEIHLWVKMY